MLAATLALAVTVGVGSTALRAAQGPGGGLDAAEQGWFGGRGGPGPGGPGGPGGRGGRGGPGGGLGFLLAPSLNLTDDQKQQVKNIVAQHKDEFQAARQKLRAAHEAQQAALEADGFNEGAIRNAATAVGAAQADLMVLGARVKTEALQVLTPEQSAKLQQLMADRDQRRAEFQQRRADRQQQKPQ
jgi:Spy/CpxP family protein refolding chaperone